MRLMLVVVAAAVALGASSAALAGPGGISLATPNPTAASGVTFAISGQKNASDLAVQIDCFSGGAQVYGTRLYVPLVNGSAITQRVYPPASSCVATLQNPQRIDVFRTLATLSFTVAP